MNGNEHDSVVDLLSNGSSTIPLYPRPPSCPKPTNRKPTRRASSVSSPYHRRTSLKVNTSSSLSQTFSTVGITTNTQGQRKSVGSIDLSSTDYSGRNVLDLRDELNRVRITLRDTTTEKQELSYEIMRLKKALEKKEKEVEDLLKGGYVGLKDKTRVAGATSKQDTLMILSSFKHRIHTLERTLRHKEEELGSLRRDIRTTRLKELEAEKEIYFTEIKRLQDIADRLRSEMNAEVPQTKKYMRTKMEEQGQSIKQLKERINVILSDLVKYKEMLGLWRNGKATVDHHDTDERKQLFSKYAKLKQGELINRLIDSEKQTQSIEAKIKHLQMKLENERIMYEEKLDSKSEEISSLHKRIEETESLLNDTRGEDTSQQDAQYNEDMEKTRLELSVTTETLNALRDYSISSSVTVKSNAAASTIQKYWRHHSSIKKQKAFDRDNNTVVTSLQSILRGHVARRQMIDQSDEVCIKLLQNIIYGHRMREKFLTSSPLS